MSTTHKYFPMCFEDLQTERRLLLMLSVKERAQLCWAGTWHADVSSLTTLASDCSVRICIPSAQLRVITTNPKNSWALRNPAHSQICRLPS